MALKDPNYSFVDLATVNMMRGWIPQLKAYFTAADTAGMAAHLAAADPHTQYALLAGRSLGQFLHGGTGAGENLQLAGTAHTTPGYVDVLSYGGSTTSKGLRVTANTKIDFATLVLHAANVVGEENPTSYSNAQMLFYDGDALAGVFSCSVGNLTAGRHFVWVAGVDRDGNKLPFAVFTTDAAGDPGSSSYAQCGLFISANQAAGTAGMVGLGGNFSSASPPSAILHLAAGTTSRAPFKYKSGPLLSTPAAGAVEFLTDKAYLTITTSAARKEFALCDAALTAGRVPFITTNGRLTDDAGLTFNSALGSFLMQKDQNGQTLVIARNYMALGNPLACAELVVQSVDSGGYLGAFPSDYTQAAYRDRVVLGANSNAAGFSFCAMATGQDIRFYAGSVTECARFDSTGHLLIGLTSGSALLHIKAGTTVAGSAPLKFNSGPVNDVNEVGTVQFLTDRWYGVITTGAALKTFAFTSDLHAAVTLASPNHGLGLSTQVLTLGIPSTCTAATTNAVTTTTHTHAVTGFSETSHNHALSGLSSHNHSDLDNIGANDHHDAISLAVSADVLLGLSGQALSLDTQTANYGLMGPATGDPAAPTFRALVEADIPTGIWAKLAGVAGGQTLIGGTGVTDILKLQGTSGNGTLTSPAIQALVGNAGGTVAWTVLNNGYTGYGTPNPYGRITVADAVPETTVLGVQGSAGYAHAITIFGDGAAFFLGRDVTNNIEFLMGASVTGGVFTGSMTAHDFWLRTDNLNRVTIKKTTGYVGIGTTIPESTLEVVYQGNSQYPCFLTVYGDPLPVPGFVGRSARGTLASPTSTQAADYLFVAGGRGFTTSVWSPNTSAVIAIKAAENFSVGNIGAYITLETTPIGSINRAERLRVTDIGNFGFNTTTFDASAAKVLALGNATAPAAHTDDQIYVYSADSSDATATLALYLEQAVEDIGTFTASHKVKILLNSVEYWIQLDAVV